MAGPRPSIAWTVHLPTVVNLVRVAVRQLRYVPDMTVRAFAHDRYPHNVFTWASVRPGRKPVIGEEMDPAIADLLARRSHSGQHSRFGEPVIEHVGRVAAAVPSEARVIAWLHDLLELRPAMRCELRRYGLTSIELSALELLTHARAEPYERYVRRIANATGPAGYLARIVKLADVSDHLAHPSIPSDAPPYAWARRMLLTSLGPAAHPAPVARAEQSRGERVGKEEGAQVNVKR